jgi:proteasome lid subunit RPN8/RPN11
MEVFRIVGPVPSAAPRPAPPLHLSLGSRVLEVTQDVLRTQSDGTREALTLWAGRPNGNSTLVVSHVITPVVVADHDWLTISLPECTAIAAFLRNEQLLAVADIHTHPKAAFLSEIDRRRPFSDRNGFYALVVPNFAAGSPGQGWRCYIVGDGNWAEVPLQDAVDGWPD